MKNNSRRSGLKSSGFKIEKPDNPHNYPYLLSGKAGVKNVNKTTDIYDFNLY